jgi:hypothetical protein
LENLVVCLNNNRRSCRVHVQRHPGRLGLASIMVPCPREALPSPAGVHEQDARVFA